MSARTKEKSPVYCIENLRSTNGGDANGVLKRIEEILLAGQHKGEGEPFKRFTASGKTCWIVPTTTAELIQVIKGSKNFKIVSGGTSDEFWRGIAQNPPELVIDVSKVKEMRKVVITDTHMRLGASLTIHELQQELKSAIKNLPELKVKVLRAFLKMTTVYASSQVRKSATIGGSLMVESKASDLQTAYTGFCVIRRFLDGVESSIKILESVDIPTSEKIEYAWYDKVSRRKDFDLALINVAATGIKTDTEKIAEGESVSSSNAFTQAAMQAVEANVCPEQIKLNPSTCAFVENTVLSMLKKLAALTERPCKDSQITKCIGGFKATRILTKIDPEQLGCDLVHRKVPHASAIGHVTGEAKYCDDTPKFKDELELALVLSTKPHAKIVNIDFTKALEIEGVVGTVKSADILEGKT